MLRLEVASLLGADGVLAAILPGGVWPTDDARASAMAAKTYPAAFDAKGEILPTALVQEDGAFPFAGTPATVGDTFRVLVWEQRGRAHIDGALARIFVLLNGAQVGATGLWVYELQFAGEGPSVRDQALADAEHGWSRWQAVVLR